MKPLHEILETAWPYLTTVEHPCEDLDSTTVYLCYALTEARQYGFISAEEEERAEDYILDAVQVLDPMLRAVYLHTAAERAGLLRPGIDLETAEYAQWRNAWFRQLIERAKHEQT